ncbi:helicase-related protein [Hyphomicrobium sp. CS1BSMeth3]|uniref:helicase-related protein n=1 Tax=Hyphomicrobium sp. CS1BSMeth3 TaxID=1892844 RepID=UPI000931F12B|nr:helicase-related protein [Hyphomicrobium sp. CS1BSMeth3]
MPLETRIRNVTAVLGPTNTGKTHLAIERMLGHESGMIGLPLRLLAREVYDRIVTRVGAGNVALITGEEKIKPERPRYWVSTVEAMPRDVEVDFLAIDEVQLAADPERGHVFTDRLLHARGHSETLLLGAGTMREAISDLIPGANFISRPRLSKLTYAGQKKLTRLPKRTAIVAFSANEVYAIAELIRRQIGGAAVVLGALSPRTRNAQVALYQSGDVDYLVATDAIGMGLNLDVDHVAFSATRKFDGQNHRDLTPGELSQIAGRAGRYMNDGTFGVTGDAEPFSADVIDRLETHSFDSVKVLQWRNRDIDLATLERLRDSLREAPREVRLQRARMADDVLALETVSADAEVRAKALGPAAVGRLWEVCQVPDYRKISSQSHADLVATLYKFLMSPLERIPTDWFSNQVALNDRTDGDIDTLATRIAHIRTWTFVANRADWLEDPAHWQERTRAIEDALSDALHEQLTQRFIDKRTSALMKGLRDKDEMNADIAADGAITVENHYVGRLKGFRFSPDANAEAQGIHGKTARNAAAHVLVKEFAMRARRVASARTDAFRLTRHGRVLWRDEEIARLEPGEDPLKPQVVLLADDNLTGPDKERVQTRLDTWMGEIIGERLKPLIELSTAEDLSGMARGIAFRLKEGLGILERQTVADDIRALDQAARGQLRKYGVRFGAFNIYLPLLLKPAAGELRLVLWALKHASENNLALDTLPEPPKAGRTSIPADPALPAAFYRATGYHLCGQRAVRTDILERLADQIRPLIAWKPGTGGGARPKGATGDGGFVVVPEMLSILGCSAEELGGVLRALGFHVDRRPAPKTMIDPAPITPVAQAEPTPEAGAEGEATAPADAGAEDGAISEADSAAVEASEATPAPATAAAETAPSEEPSAREVEAPAAAPEAADAPAEASAEAAPADAAEAAPAVTAEAAAEAAPATAEEILIEIWRPRRRHRGDHRAVDGRQRQGERHGDRNRRHGRDGGRDGRREGGRQPDRQSDRPGTPAPAAQASGEAAPAPAQGEERRDGGRRDRHQRGGPPRNRDGERREGRPDQQREQRPREDRERRHGGGKGHGEGRRDDRRDDRRPPREERSQGYMRSAAPPKRTTVDPDSPFAALSALKLQLEKRGNETGSS